MHRHGYKGRKFGRERDQRAALLSGLAESLILHTSIETTVPKAKEAITVHCGRLEASDSIFTQSASKYPHSLRQRDCGGSSFGLG